MKKNLILLLFLCLGIEYAVSVEPFKPNVSTQHDNVVLNNTLFAYATYQALLDAISDVPDGSVIVVKYAKFKEDKENKELNDMLKDFVVNVLVKSKKYRVIRDAEMAPTKEDYYEVYVLEEWVWNPNEKYQKDEDCEGSYSLAKVEVIQRSTGVVVGSSRKQVQQYCGNEYNETTSSFKYIRFMEEYKANW